MEIIIKIEEASNRDGIGYQIVTNKQIVELLIDDFQQCCETFGYFMSEDDLSTFIGSELHGIFLVDDAINHRKLKEKEIYVGDVVFVNINTSNGLLQFVAYNEHNGYYGHEVIIKSNQLSHREWL